VTTTGIAAGTAAMTELTPIILDSLDGLTGVLRDVEQDFAAENFKPTLQEFVPVLEKDEASYFEGRHSPGGELWPALSPITVRKKGHDIPLVETGRLKRSLIDSSSPEAVRKVDPRELTFGTSDEHSPYHQYGTQRIPQREHVGTEPETVDEFANDVADSAVEQLKK
jgi:phage gpG-like protein